MTIRTSPAPARTDAPSRATAPTIGTTTVRTLGAVLAAGAAAWAVDLIVEGPNAVGSVPAMLTALAFQIGVLCLLQVQWRTGAIGTGRPARSFWLLEHVVLAGAIVNTLLDNDGSSVFLLICDLCWPLSMIGMAAIGVRIAIRGRWHGVLRAWPLVAETWAFVAVPASAIVPALAGYVGGGHLLIGYATLGLLLALRPRLTGAL